MSFNQWASEHKILASKRGEFMKLAEKMKEREKELEGEMINYMVAQGHTAIRVDGVGIISKTQTLQIQIADAEKMCDYMFRRMTETLSENGAKDPLDPSRKPLEDALLFQKTAKQSAIQEILEKKEFPTWEEKAKFAEEVLGARLVHKIGLSYKA